MFSTRDDETFTGGDIDIILPNDILKAQLSPGKYCYGYIQKWICDIVLMMWAQMLRIQNLGISYVSCEGFTLFDADSPLIVE